MSKQFYTSTNMDFSYQLTYEEIQYLSLLLGVISDQNWQTFDCAMLSNPTVFQSFARKVSQSTELNSMTILHACIRFNPPTYIVKTLLGLLPEAPSCVDCLQRTPLHVAAGTRASLPLIQLLAKAYPRACEIQDKDGKTPLHLACDSEGEIFEGDDGDDDAMVVTKREPPSYDVVLTLVKTSIPSVPLEDQDGMSALEHAILSDAPIMTVKLLQYATRKHCEAHQKTSEFVKEFDLLMEKSKTKRNSTSLLDREPSGIVITPEAKGEFSSWRLVHQNQNSLSYS